LRIIKSCVISNLELNEEVRNLGFTSS